MSERAVVFDTETTGLDAPEVIQMAWLEPQEGLNAGALDQAVQQQRFKPSKPISLGAMATHHIFSEELQEQPPWPGKWDFKVEYLVGHNVDFDWKAIGSPPVRRICTLALARSLWPDIDSHSLGALSYYTAEDRQKIRHMLRNAHDAAVDVELTVRLLLRIVEEFAKRPTNWSELWELSEKARVPVRFTFGKYGPKDGKKGAVIADVRRSDPGYIKWCLGVKEFAEDPYLSKALRGAA